MQDWSVRYNQEEPVQPRYEINAPDLYIPLMAVVTYILVAGLCLGLQERWVSVISDWCYVYTNVHISCT